MSTTKTWLRSSSRSARWSSRSTFCVWRRTWALRGIGLVQCVVQGITPTRLTDELGLCERRFHTRLYDAIRSVLSFLFLPSILLLYASDIPMPRVRGNCRNMQESLNQTWSQV